MKKFDIITIFPELFSDFASQSLISKAIKNKLISIKAHNLRKWTSDRHQTVDGKPYGGGPGLVFKVEPIYKAVQYIKSKVRSKNVKVRNLTFGLRHSRTRVVLFSPRGRKFDQAMAKKWAKLDQIIFICGRYEGVDERVAEHIADEVISIGDFVLNGGEVAAMVVIEAVSRLISGFMHKEESASKFDHAQYTKPEVFNNWKVPKVLLSGDHAKIKTWREKKK